MICSSISLGTLCSCAFIVFCDGLETSMNLRFEDLVCMLIKAQVAKVVARIGRDGVFAHAKMEVTGKDFVTQTRTCRVDDATGSEATSAHAQQHF